MIAALFVQPDGVYAGLDGVDPWPASRDARLYAGWDPVVAHPPCARWYRLAYFCQSMYGAKVGDDGGTFAAALAAVRRCGGVLEHPAHTLAWAAHDLVAPSSAGVWQQTIFGEWVGWVEQIAYGHRARKPTWLLYRGDVPPTPLRSGRGMQPTARVGAWRRHQPDRPQLRGRAASATPIAFRDYLLDLAARSRADLNLAGAPS